MDNPVDILGRMVASSDNQKVMQHGLYSTNDDEVQQFVKRVNKWNTGHIGSPVKLNILECKEGDQHCADPHYKFQIEFPTREAQIAFWRGYD